MTAKATFHTEDITALGEFPSKRHSPWASSEFSLETVSPRKDKNTTHPFVYQ